MAITPTPPSFREAFFFWLKLGFISFGGPAGQIAIMQEFLVHQKKWISPAKFLHALNYCMLLPGPEAQQLAAYIGWLLHGIRGGLVAGVLFVLPSVFILLGLSIIYVTYGQVPWIAALFYGLKPAVVAIVLAALFKIGKKALITPWHYAVALISFILIFFLNVPFPLIILSTLLVGALISWRFPDFFPPPATTAESLATEETYYLNNHIAIPNAGFKFFRLLRQLAITALLWVFPLALLYAGGLDFTFWKTLCLFFSKAALVTFGGAYAVLPYVAQVSVEQLHWLSELQMIDGLALGETTPGPLIMVLAFVGFMGSYHHFNQSILMGSIGLLATTYYTFLFCFLFIFAGAPIIEKTQQNTRIKTTLGLVTAAVVGVILNLSVYFGKAVLLPRTLSLAGLDYFALIWLLISFVALHKFKLNMILWIGISALAGLVVYLTGYSPL